MQRLLGPGVRSVPTSCSFAGTWLCPVTPHTVVQAQNEEGRIMDVVSLLVYSLPPSLASTWLPDWSFSNKHQIKSKPHAVKI